MNETFDWAHGHCLYSVDSVSPSLLQGPVHLVHDQTRLSRQDTYGY